MSIDFTWSLDVLLGEDQFYEHFGNYKGQIIDRYRYAWLPTLALVAVVYVCLRGRHVHFDIPVVYRRWSRIRGLPGFGGFPLRSCTVLYGPVVCVENV